jgi:glycosyltransferase involved in cell wall biosynthesis
VPEGVDVTNLGWCDDLRDAYVNATALVRFTDHDGLSLMVLEALSYGRHVVWTQAFPFVKRARQCDELEGEIRSLFAAHERAELVPQDDASAFIRRYYSPHQSISALAQAWEDAIVSANARDVDLSGETASVRSFPGP